MNNDEQDNRLLREYVELCRRMPPLQPAVDASLAMASKLVCACGKTRQKADMPRRKSSVLQFMDDVCFSCQKSYTPNHATIVCIRCKRTIARATPGVDAGDKFRFVAGAVYHVESCPVCSGVGQAEVIEHILHRKKNNLPNPLRAPACQS